MKEVLLWHTLSMMIASAAVLVLPLVLLVASQKATQSMKSTQMNALAAEVAQKLVL